MPPRLPRAFGASSRVLLPRAIASPGTLPIATRRLTSRAPPEQVALDGDARLGDVAGLALGVFQVDAVDVVAGVRRNDHDLGAPVRLPLELGGRKGQNVGALVVAAVACPRPPPRDC